MINTLLIKRKTAEYTLIAVIFAVSIFLACTYFSGAYIDLYNAIILSLKRIGIFFTRAFIDPGAATPPSAAPSIPDTNIGGAILPITPDYLGTRFALWGNLLISCDMYSLSGNMLIKYSMVALQLLMIMLPCIFMICVLAKKIIFQHNTKHGEISIPLKMHFGLKKIIYDPTSFCLRSVIYDFKNNRYLKISILAIWALNFNVITILLNFISFYLYFAVTMNFADIYYAIIEFILSLKYLAIGSGAILIVGGILIFDKWRKIHALTKLEKMELFNQELLKGRDISTFKWGNMGCGKTRLLTDQALSLSIMDRNIANELMSFCRQMFEIFDWLSFELELEKQIAKKRVYNWASALTYVNEIYDEFEKGQNTLFGYKITNKTTFCNGIVNVPLRDTLEDYARLYVLYANPSSYILSNYPIREDKAPYTVGNSIKWDDSFFNFNRSSSDSEYSKILNFDMIRGGKRFTASAANDSLEYGIIVITEADKEQMNALETLEDSKESPYPNPKNDGMSKYEKFVRHHATVMGHCFAHILKDGQRTQSINADAREIMTLERIYKPKREKSTLPLSWIDKGIYFIFNRIYEKFDDEQRYNRGDTTLITYLMRRINHALFINYAQVKNRYGYAIVRVDTEHGKGDGNIETQKYYLMNAKIYADRYNTATLEEYFMQKTEASKVGIQDLRSYSSTVMTSEEFAMQNCYVQKELTDPEWREPYKQKQKLEQEKEKALVKRVAKLNAEKEIRKEDI